MEKFYDDLIIINLYLKFYDDLIIINLYLKGFLAYYLLLIVPTSVLTLVVVEGREKWVVG